MRTNTAFSKVLHVFPYGAFRFLPPKRFFGKSVVAWSNILFFQWLFLRLWWNVNSQGLTIGISGFVVPLTGWWSDYVWVGRWGDLY